MVVQDACYTLTRHFFNRGGWGENAHHIFLGDVLLTRNLVLENPLYSKLMEEEIGGLTFFVLLTVLFE